MTKLEQIYYLYQKVKSVFTYFYFCSRNPSYTRIYLLIELAIVVKDALSEVLA